MSLKLIKAKAHAKKGQMYGKDKTRRVKFERTRGKYMSEDDQNYRKAESMPCDKSVDQCFSSFCLSHREDAPQFFAKY